MKEKHVELLLRSVTDWNKWMEENKSVVPDLQRADLRGADLQRADLRGADLWGADLWGADLRGADLRGADLRGADLQGADLQRADLQRADLRGADLWGAAGVIQLGPVDCWVGNIVLQDNAVQINFGCRSFRTLAEAEAHWNGGERDGERRPYHDRIMLEGVRALVEVARAHGWRFEV